jgi:hypothetical protein
VTQPYRVVTANARCQLGTIRSRCPNPAAGSCQYCGRHFCAEHGSFEDDHQEVCCRDVCQEKFADVRDFQPYKRRSLERNGYGVCGVEDCMDTLWGGCSKCEAVYCERHITLTLEQRRQGRRTWKQPLAVCPRCALRLKLWAKT